MNNLIIKKYSRWSWLLVSGWYLVFSIGSGLIIIMILNGNWANHILTPVFQFLSLFQMLWNDNPAGAIWFLVRKSLFTFAHQDPRSGLNLWTFEFNSLTLLVYIVVSLLMGRMLNILNHSRLDKKTIATTAGLCLVGSVLMLFSISFMTAIEHCSGATWVGFVALYGLGFDEFQLYPAWQWIAALTGCGLYLYGFTRLRKRIKQENTQ